ncbi:hypothetical protein [Sphingomonas sp.]|nr:hypothetical protein [Sphingomonas sp.]
MVNSRALKFRIFLVAVAFGCTSPSRAATSVSADAGATRAIFDALPD